MNQTQKRMKLIHGLANETRLAVLEQLTTGEKTVSELLNNIGCSQSNLSQHLACLRACGFVKNRQEGKFVYYELAHQELVHLLSVIDEVTLSMAWTENDSMICATHVD